MESLRNLYQGRPIWIIGKGPSLQYLEIRDVAPGPVIAINDAIIRVEEIGTPGPVFSMQKDGGPRRRPSDKFPPASDCDYSPNCGDVCGSPGYQIYRPRRGATLLVHRHESFYCFPDYTPRIVFDCADLGIPPWQFSLIVAIKIGQLMGCNVFNFVSCDSYVTGFLETFIPGGGVAVTTPLYIEQVRRTGPYLEGLNCRWITPEPR